MTLFSDHAVGEPGEPGEPGQTGPESVEPGLRRRVSLGWLFVALAFVLLLVMIAAPAPYVIEQPGPVFNTLGSNQQVWPKAPREGTVKPLISVPDKTTYPTGGSLDLLTVSVVGTPDGLPSWGQVLSAWFDPTKAVIPVDAAYPQGQSVEQQNNENAQLMANSQQDAIAAALDELGYDFPQRTTVKTIFPGTPAVGVFRTGDVITAVDGEAVHGTQSLRDLIGKVGAGQRADFAIVRDDKPMTVTAAPEKTASGTIVGVGVAMQYDFPFTVSIELNNVGGPSAGQMFALGIIDKLSPGKLNGGKSVAGTGTIDNEGNVGPIGGIRQKMAAARAAGATWFLAPNANCDEVTGHVPQGMRVFAVKTLDDSLRVMHAARDGGADALPTCAAR